MLINQVSLPHHFLGYADTLTLKEREEDYVAILLVTLRQKLRCSIVDLETGKIFSWNLLKKLSHWTKD